MRYAAVVVMAVMLAACGHGSGGGADTRNESASLPETPRLHPREWRVITSSIDQRGGTMSTLYGNDVAVKSARSGRPYAVGARLSLVTWKQRPDENWFGANIPDTVQSVEEITFSTAAPEAGAPQYTKYEGKSLTPSATSPEVATGRIATIVGQRASVMP